MTLTSDIATRVNRVLDTVGNGTGTKNGNLNGSVTPQYLRLTPPSTKTYILTHLTVTIRDSGQFTAALYGALAALTNGISFGTFTMSGDATDYDYTDGVPIQTNSCWARMTSDLQYIHWGDLAGENIIIATIDFAKMGVMPKIKPSDSSYFGVKISDDLTGLIEHYFMAHGFQSGS